MKLQFPEPQDPITKRAMKRFFICDDCGKRRVIMEACRISVHVSDPKQEKLICLTCNNKRAYNEGIISAERLIKSYKSIVRTWRNKKYLQAHEEDDFLENI